MDEIINIKEIMSYIPHRYPFLLIDKIVEYRKGEDATGVKNVTINEEFFNGHFPGNPIMPGVLQIEALAQTACVLVIKSMGKKAPKESGILFTGIEKVRFRKQVLPGDQLYLSVRIVKQKLSVYVIDGTGIVNGQKVVEAKFSAILYDRSKKEY